VTTEIARTEGGRVESLAPPGCADPRRRHAESFFPVWRFSAALGGGSGAWKSRTSAVSAVSDFGSGAICFLWLPPAPRRSSIDAPLSEKTPRNSGGGGSGESRTPPRWALT